MKKLLSLPFWVFIAMLIFAGCNKEEATDLEVKSSSELELKSGHAAQNQILAEIRKATAKYLNYDKAIADGYFLPPGGHCVAHPELGGMGYHYINPNAGLEVDPSNPQVLLYEPMKNGKKRLVGVEFIVPYYVWNEVFGADNPPMLGNVPFEAHPNAPAPPNGPGPTYQLHVWVWKNNPSGMYSAFNPNVSCYYSEH